MANRNFNRKQALEKEVKDLYAKVAIGAAGAPTLDSASVGIASITRTSAGLYELTLQDAYNSLKAFQVMVVDDTAQDRNAQVMAEDVAGEKTISFATLAVATATDPANGAVLHIHLDLKNSSVR